MPTSRTTYTKRQKERARQEKQAEKAQKRAERKLQPAGSAESEEPNPNAGGELKIQYDEEGQPLELDFHDFQ